MKSSRKICEKDAPYVFIAYWGGDYVDRICARYDVDPRRVYDVLRDRTYPGARFLALRILRESNPALAAQAETGALDPRPETTISREPKSKGPANQIEMEF